MDNHDKELNFELNLGVILFTHVAILEFSIDVVAIGLVRAGQVLGDGDLRRSVHQRLS